MIMSLLIGPSYMSTEFDILKGTCEFGCEKSWIETMELVRKMLEWAGKGAGRRATRHGRLLPAHCRQSTGFGGDFADRVVEMVRGLPAHCRRSTGFGGDAPRLCPQRPGAERRKERTGGRRGNDFDFDQADAGPGGSGRRTWGNNFDFDGEESNLGYRNKDLDLTQLPSARAASRGGERDASRPTTRLPVRSTRRSKPEALGPARKRAEAGRAPLCLAPQEVRAHPPRTRPW